jgi:hypothetical protein
MAKLLISDARTSKATAVDARRIKALLVAVALACGLLTLAAKAHGQNVPSASWTPLAHSPPSHSVGTMMLLTDGTVFAQNGDDLQHWLRLSPDAHGNYVNGTWTTLAPMSIPRLYFTSDVLQDGRVWVLGGEYTGPYLDPNWASSAEIYDPVHGSWSPAASYPNEEGGCFPITFTSDVRLTKGSTMVAGVYSTDRMLAGWTITGSGVPAGAKIVSVNSAQEVTMSAKATASGLEKAVVFAGTPLSCFGDDPSSLITQRRILAGNLLNNSTYLYSIDSDSWTQAASKVYKDSSDEEGWTGMRGGQILTYDLDPSIATGHGYAELYNSSTQRWRGISPADGSANGNLPLLSSTALGYELGPVLRLQDGRGFIIGANQHTALYDQTANTWSAGPDTFGTLSNPFGSIEHALFGADDAPAALMPNGHVLYAADAGANPLSSSGTTTAGSPIISNIPSTAGLQIYWYVFQANGKSHVIPPNTYITSIDSRHQIHISANAKNSASGVPLVLGGVFSNPTQLFDFDPLSQQVTPVSPALADPNLPYDPSYLSRMLVLPSGQVLFNDGVGSQLYVYTPAGTANPKYAPVVTKVEYSGGGVFKLTGTQLNGPSYASAYGDDVQSNENYPIVRLQNGQGLVFYCRSRNWTSTRVGNISETVQFTLNPAVAPGTYELTVSAGGIPSAPVPLTVTSGQLGSGL